ncbi:MAG: acyl-[acyl-carrier-protein] thioesterase [Clostridiales bacterium]|nr:acyl-[acyl-carrier-protein] thioesterase [Candidatus Blautia equi]
MPYSFEGKIRFSEVGEDGRLTLPGILNYFQDCSTFQSEEKGQGIKAVQGRGRVWVLSFWQIVVNRFPAMAEAVKTSTWPYDFRAFMGSRNFTMETAAGEPLAWANSIWSYIDMENGAPARLREEDLNGFELEPKLQMDYAPRKIAVPADCEKKESFTIQKHHLDTNHHVNNVQYISMAAEYLPENFRIREMRAEYKKQVFLGDSLYPEVSLTDGQATVVLRNEGAEVCTIIQFIEEKK